MTTTKTLVDRDEVMKILLKEKLEWRHSEFLSVIEEYFDTVKDKITSLPIESQWIDVKELETLKEKAWKYDSLTK